MATKDKPKKPKWWKTMGEAFSFVRKNDPFFLPAFIVMFVLISGTGIALGFVGGSVTSHVYSNLIATLLVVTGTLVLLTVRIDRAAFRLFEGQMGGSLRAAQSIRRGWKFEEAPIEVESKGRGIVFLGVGRGGIALVAEGGQAARRPMQQARTRLTRVVPGVPIHEFYAGKGHGELRLRQLSKAIKGLKKILSKRERAAIEARIHALGGARIPLPKGVDPMRMRPDRKAMRGR